MSKVKGVQDGLACWLSVIHKGGIVAGRWRMLLYRIVRKPLRSVSVDYCVRTLCGRDAAVNRLIGMENVEVDECGY